MRKKAKAATTRATWFGTLAAISLLVGLNDIPAVEAQSAAEVDYAPAVLSCRQLLRERDPDAEPFCKDLLAQEDVADTGKSRIRLDLISRAIMGGNFASAEEQLQDPLLRSSIFQQDTIYRYHLLRMRALLQYQQDNLMQAVPHMREALQVATNIQAPARVATSENDLGAVYMEMGEYIEALNHFRRALGILESSEKHYSRGLTLANIAQTYRELDDPANAIEYLERAADAHSKNLEQQPDDSYGLRALAQVNEDLGLALMMVGKLDMAADKLGQALATYESASWTVDQIRVLAEQADVARLQGKLLEANVLIETALALESTTSPKRSIETRSSMVALFRETRDFARARLAAEQGLDIAVSSDQRTEELEFLKQLSEIAEQLGDYRSALDYLRAYLKQYTESLKETYSAQLARLQSSIEMQQQLQSIQLLEAEQESLRKAITLQRALLIAAGVLVTLLLAFIALFRRNQQARRSYLSREIALHRQVLTSDEESSNAQDRSDKDYENDAPDPATDDGSGRTNCTASETDNFSAALVSLMCSAIEIWEQSTGLTRIELAEQSRAWQVSIDNGRLRTRTMDRYCDIQKLPKSPRWRQVVRTCRHILIHCDLTDSQRERLNRELEEVFERRRQSAVSGQTTPNEVAAS
jgi:tetratricopeptide (TPR) repeat protein